MSLRIIILSLFIGLLFFACETSDVPKIKGPTDIRIHNASDHTMQNVLVGGLDYGDIASGETTGYQEFEVAYRYSSVRLTIQDTLAFALIPIDYVGETPLGKGKFTYTLDVFDLRSTSVNLTHSKD